MALEKGTVPVPVAGGLDTKTDPRQTPPGKLLVAENVYIQKTGELKKADGSTQLTRTASGGPTPTLSSAKQLSNLGDELCVASNDAFYTYSPTFTRWKYKNTDFKSVISTKSVASGSVSLRNPVSAIANNVVIHAWEDPATTTVVYTVIDLQTNAVLIPQTSITNSLVAPRITTTGQYVFLSWLTTSASHQYYIFDTLSLTNMLAVTPFTATGATFGTKNYDICTYNGGMALAGIDTTGALYGYIFSTAGATVTGPTSLGTAGIWSADGRGSPRVILFPGDVTANTLGILYARENAAGSPGLYHGMLNTSLGFAKAAQIVDAPSNRNTTMGSINFSAYYDGVQSVIIYNRGNNDYTGGANETTHMAIWAVLVTFSTNGLSTFAVSSAIGPITSRIFSVNSTLLFLCTYENRTLDSTDPTDRNQTSTFLMSFGSPSTYNNVIYLQGTIFAAGKSGPPGYFFSKPSTISASKVLMPLLENTRVISDNGHIYSISSISAATLDFSSDRFPPGQTLGQSLYLQGSILKAYDGSNLVEAGFTLSPEIIQGAFKNNTGTSSTEPTQVTTGGSIAPGTYLYRAIYEWRDGNGQLFQSGPSSAVSVTVPVGTSTNVVTLKVKALTFTSKRKMSGSFSIFEPDSTDISIVLYRTTNGGTTYYRVNSEASPTLNTNLVRVGAGYVSIADTVSDTDISSKQILYTTSGEVDNINTPSPSLVLTAKNRIFIVSGEDPSAVYYSKQLTQGLSPGFSDQFRKAVNPEFGNITALGNLDDKIVFFKSTAIYVMNGDGPLLNGQQDTFGEPTAIASDVGCSNPASVVEMPLGLMFQSSKGIYLLSRALDVVYIGQEIEDFNSLTVSGAFVLTYANQVRFTTTAGTTLVYDYQQKTWTVRTNEASVASLTWKNQAVFLTSTGFTSLETIDQATTNGSPIITKVKTGFQSFAGLQGFQRVWRVLVLGAFRGNHVLKVSIFTDFKATADDVFYVAVGDSAYLAQASVIALTTQAATFVGTSADPAYQFAVKNRVQKCESMAVQIEDVFPTGTGTKAFNVSSISFEVGSKGKLKRLSTSANMLKG